ncbi:DNA cytosine methyltransferase [Caproiciproducens galactitolivorans]|uniref:DNA (cytosine-5-)-methyltransferase n=1 Tax=Caproiciproducens galactitolivorans TaxID=642589 RepID=A0ABT4BR65_9FIRM|nr:DNA cytosine methyltransferase [Caproiciproducens galactitolivorans]MCY1713389.1 DNA cytosine methyltransferase [Caproiciproducens galactitolivorans]
MFGINFIKFMPSDYAILMHKTNHPYTQHYCENVWAIDPVKACHGQKVGLAWFSPDCKHFSKAKGGKPVSKKIRGLAWIVLKWAAKVRPRVIILENVDEFQTWGPVRKGKPVKKLAGTTFHKWESQLHSLGYEIEHRELRACDYGAPTIRKRFSLIARNDGKPIVWPEPTHGAPGSPKVKSGKLKPWRTAAEIIDWSLPCSSIFERKKPLAENTMRRIARGIQKFVIDNPEPFIVNYKFSNEAENTNQPLSTITAVNSHYVVAPSLIQYHSETVKNEVRGQSITEPIMTVDSSPRYALVSAFISKFYKTGIGQSMSEPLHTVTTSPGHFAEIQAFLIKYYGQGTGQKVSDPLDTVVSKDRFGLVTIHGVDYQIVDIGMRMLTPRELYAAQGAPADYIIDHDYTGKTYPKNKQVARCGNMVPPPFAKALVMANLPELCVRHCSDMTDLNNTVAV